MTDGRPQTILLILPPSGSSGFTPTYRRPSFRKSFARNIPTEYSASDLSTRLDPDMLSIILYIRRRTMNDGSASDRIEFVFSTVNVPRRLSLASVAFELTAIIPHPKRCFSCQRFRHISEQCRSTHPTCEYSSEYLNLDLLHVEFNYISSALPRVSQSSLF